MCPLLSAVGQAVGQADPLPGQQAVRAELGEQGHVEDPDGGLSHQQAAPKQVEVVQRHEEAWRRRRRRRMKWQRPRIEGVEEDV